MLVDALHQVQVLENWETLTSRIRMMDVKRRFLEQNNNWYRFTKGLRMLDLKRKLAEIQNEDDSEEKQVEATPEAEEKHGRIDQPAKSAPQRNWFRIIKELRKIQIKKLIENYASEAEDSKQEQVEVERTPVDERWFTLVRGLRRKGLEHQFKISSQDWLRFAMGLRRADRKQRVASFVNPWLTFTKGLRMKELRRRMIFASNAWLRYTMGLRRKALEKKYEWARNHWLRYIVRLRLHSYKVAMEGVSASESERSRAYSGRWKDITQKLRFRELQYRLHDIQQADP